MVTDVPDGLSRMAARFLLIHAVRVGVRPVEQYRAASLNRGVPAGVIDRAAELQARWGGLVLPPAPHYEGGPLALSMSYADSSLGEGWWIHAGEQRCSVPFSFWISPDGEFGIQGRRWVPLHASVGGWIESVALAYHAAVWARQVTRVSGSAVDELDLSALERVPLVAGMADTWWRGPDSLVAVYRGEADCFDRPGLLRAQRYDGLPDHAFLFDS